MNYLIRISSVIVLMMLATTGLFAQHRNIRFDNITINEGLSQSSVNVILQDREGFIWIATQDGLNKFDGYHFAIFKNDPNNNRTISNNFIYSLCEDKDGYLWMGTDGGGLNRFDKYSLEFKRFDFGDENRFVVAVAEDKEGFIWFGTNNGNLNRLDKNNGVIQKYGKDLNTNSVQTIFNDSKGNLWIGTANGLFEFDFATKKFTNYKKTFNSNSLADDFVWSITEDKEENLWIGTNNGLSRLMLNGGEPSYKNYFHDPNNPFSLSGNAVKAVYVTSENILHIGTAGNGMDKLDLNNPKEFYTYTHSDFIQGSLSDDQVQSIFEDRFGLIWIGTNSGLSKYDPSKQFFDHIRHSIDNPNSLNDKTVWCMAEDKNGILWVGTREGINAVNRKRNRYHRFSFKGKNPNALNNNSVLSVFIDSDQTIWAGTIDGLYKVKPAEDFSTVQFVPVPFRRALTQFSDTRIYKITEDDDGYIWVASKEGLSRINKSTGDFNFYQNIPSDKTSLPSNLVRNVYRDNQGNIWACTDAGGITLVVKEGDKILFRTYRHRLTGNNNGNDVTMIISVWEENDGTFWLGTYGAGLQKFNFKDEQFESYTEKNGLPNNVVYGVLGDGKGNLWLSTNRGLSRFNIKHEEFQNYLQKDGLQSNEFNVGAYYKNSKGEIFFGGIDGLNSFFPGDIKNNSKEPIMVLTDLLLQNKKLEIGNEILSRDISVTKEITLSRKQNNITIRFSALHFSNPESNQYKYIMEGYDENYNFLSNSREAHYTNLPPGDYTFKVYGSNSDGVWSKQPATLIIHVTPPFWATWWFRTLAVILVLVIGFGVNQARIWRIKQQRLYLAKEVRDRTREVIIQKEQIEQQKALIEAEKVKVENLLLNILPEETAEELKSKGKASARSYRQVSIMFTDFVGFTKIAEKMRPPELVAKLDSYFVSFDDIVAKYNLEKIKTIGDAYMCAAGVPIRSKSNPIDTTLAALHIQRHMKELHENDPEGHHWKLRIGINTGEIIAGVIGTKRFAYDIWGNAVNVAQRMEMAGEAFKVNVSGSTFQEIEPYFEFTYRGKIAAKNKGEVDMYYVDGIKPELSVDGLGIEPNEKFWKYVDLYLYSSINYKKAERHIMKILHEKLPDNLYYHGIHHTYDVIQAAERLALMEGITDEQMFILKSAATYHDAGFVEQYAKNEPIGIRMAQEILPKYGYVPEQVEEVAKLIRATIVPHDPQSHLQQIICDADLDYLGRDDFHPISETLKHELKERGIVKGDREWDEMQVKFFNLHKYFTESAIKLRQPKKDKHLQDILKRLEENNYES